MARQCLQASMARIVGLSNSLLHHKFTVSIRTDRITTKVRNQIIKYKKHVLTVKENIVKKPTALELTKVRMHGTLAPIAFYCLTGRRPMAHAL